MTAAFSVSGYVVTLACRQWKAGRFWPSPTNGTLAKVSTDLKAMFARVYKLAGIRTRTMRREVADIRTRFDVAGSDGVQAAFY